MVLSEASLTGGRTVGSLRGIYQLADASIQWLVTYLTPLLPDTIITDQSESSYTGHYYTQPI